MPRTFLGFGHVASARFSKLIRDSMSLIHFSRFPRLAGTWITKRGFNERYTSTSRTAEQQTFIILGVLLQFLSTPEQINDEISVMHGTMPTGVVVPLHSYADPDIFYVLDGSLEVFQAGGWQTSMPATSFLSPETAGTRSEILLPPQQPEYP